MSRGRCDSLRPFAGLTYNRIMKEALCEKIEIRSTALRTAHRIEHGGRSGQKRGGVTDRRRAGSFQLKPRRGRSKQKRKDSGGTLPAGGPEKRHPYDHQGAAGPLHKTDPASVF